MFTCVLSTDIVISSFYKRDHFYYFEVKYSSKYGLNVTKQLGLEWEIINQLY